MRTGRFRLQKLQTWGGTLWALDGLYLDTLHGMLSSFAWTSSKPRKLGPTTCSVGWVEYRSLVTRLTLTHRKIRSMFTSQSIDATGYRWVQTISQDSIDHLCLDLSCAVVKSFLALWNAPVTDRSGRSGRLGSVGSEASPLSVAVGDGDPAVVVTHSGPIFPKTSPSLRMIPNPYWIIMTSLIAIIRHHSSWSLKRPAWSESDPPAAGTAKHRWEISQAL